MSMYAQDKHNDLVRRNQNSLVYYIYIKNYTVIFNGRKTHAYIITIFKGEQI